MLKEENMLFTIGQFAALHEINKKTLMWYDEIGLLKPACIKENGYRYYSYQQSAALETILMLRELNVSLDEIKHFMEYRTIDSFDYLLKEKIAELSRTISHLKSVQKVLSNHQHNIEMLRSLDISAISLVQKQGCYLVSVDISANTSFEKEVGQVIAETKKYQLHRLHDASYGSMIPVENLLQGKYDEYTALYIEMPHPISKKGLHFKPAGTYLRAFCKGSWEKLSDRYQEILAYVEKQGLSLYGYAYETGINELVINSIDEYITQIEIPVEWNN
ncbi:MAG: MerR family transcriptional regulator [Lachnospiraceae bacterium]|nr:MerR family transcriptional regulator [Lachnospiraceae bacterium]